MNYKYFEVFYSLNNVEFFSMWSDYPFPAIEDGGYVTINGTEYIVVKKTHSRSDLEVTTNYYVTPR